MPEDIIRKCSHIPKLLQTDFLKGIATHYSENSNSVNKSRKKSSFFTRYINTSHGASPLASRAGNLLKDLTRTSSSRSSPRGKSHPGPRQSEEEEEEPEVAGLEDLGVCIDLDDI